VQSAFSYNGQKCSALSRLIVLDDNYEKFLQRLIAARRVSASVPARIPAMSSGR